LLNRKNGFLDDFNVRLRNEKQRKCINSQHSQLSFVILQRGLIKQMSRREQIKHLLTANEFLLLLPPESTFYYEEFEQCKQTQELLFNVAQTSIVNE
jgi:hypothetical protein